ncbi:uroporphyrinogen decarboxylase family protein [Neomoorella mulderi]|uniref:Uroporphyrinogen decarboxylase n=1 Tax=Moorella mulderi DSM 14980 TaxID=1122241 RepID=A0A151B002_9FIRM|nr:uroporphyrinogen decarboxylase family protein [Moorella mulderi]KYH33113.1 uroporphyrinogen decarboxylase [Moorella mulderi DSM 14980]
MKLSHKERVLRSIARKEIDHLPIQIEFTPAALDKVTKAWGVPNNEEYLIERLDNHLVYAYLNDPFGKIRKRIFTPEEKILYDEWGVGWDTQQEGTFIAYHPLANLEKYKDYQFPDPYSPDLMDFAKETVAKYAGEYLVPSYQVTCLFERAWALRGFENFLMDMILNRDFAEELLEKITDYQVEIAKRYVETGVNCGRTGDDYGGQNTLLMSPNLWREMIKPRLARIWAVYKEAGLPVIHHTCGDVRLILDDLVDMGLDILHPVQPQAMPIEELAQRYGKNLTFYGGISTQVTLPFGTPEEVRHEVKRCIEVLGAYGSYIIAPSIQISSEVPMANIEALIQAVEDYKAGKL